MASTARATRALLRPVGVERVGRVGRHDGHVVGAGAAVEPLLAQPCGRHQRRTTRWGGEGTGKEGMGIGEISLSLIGKP